MKQPIAHKERVVSLYLPQKIDPENFELASPRDISTEEVKILVHFHPENEATKSKVTVNAVEAIGKGSADSAAVGNETDPVCDNLEDPAENVESRVNKEAGGGPVNGGSSLGGAMESATAAAKSDVEGSEASSAYEDEETSDEEVDSLDGEGKQDEVVPADPQGIASHTDPLGEGLSSSGSDEGKQPSADPIGGVKESEEVDDHGIFSPFDNQSKEEKVVARLPKAEVTGEYEVESGETTNQGRSALVFSKGIEVKKVNVIELNNTVLTSESPSAVLRTGSKLLKIVSTSESLFDSVEEGYDKGVYVDGVSGEEDDGSSAENDSMEEGVPGQDRPFENEVSNDYRDDVLDSELGDFGSKSGEDTDFGSKLVSLSKELKEEYVHFTAETKKADMTEGTSQLFSCNLSQRIDDKDLGTVDNLERVSGGEEVGPKVAMAGVILDAHYVFDKMPQSNPKGHHQNSEAKQDGLLSAKFCDGLSNSNEVCSPKKTWANIVGSNSPGSSRLNQ
ncbi:hypothetical protein U1Q18_017894 [Sarracenia purpurea var. burkii]